VTRYLTVTCTRKGCKAEARVEFGRFPGGWLIVAYAYDSSNPMEFCSHDCLQRWSASMQKAHAETREWKARPVTPKPIDAVPAGAML